MTDTKPVQTEKRPVGRPSAVDGKRVQVYLDAESLKTAALLGHGNVSEGIRKALRRAQDLANIAALPES
jgi:hypothetical protein